MICFNLNKGLAEAISLIEDGLRRLPSATVSRDRAAQVAAWRALGSSWQSDTTPQQEIQAIYDARTGGRSVEL